MLHFVLFWLYQEFLVNMCDLFINLFQDSFSSATEATWKNMGKYITWMNWGKHDISTAHEKTTKSSAYFMDIPYLE